MVDVDDRLLLLKLLLAGQELGRVDPGGHHQVLHQLPGLQPVGAVIVDLLSAEVDHRLVAQRLDQEEVKVGPLVASIQAGLDEAVGVLLGRLFGPGLQLGPGLGRPGRVEACGPGQVIVDEHHQGLDIGRHAVDLALANQLLHRPGDEPVLGVLGREHIVREGGQQARGHHLCHHGLRDLEDVRTAPGAQGGDQLIEVGVVGDLLGLDDDVLVGGLELGDQLFEHRGAPLMVVLPVHDLHRFGRLRRRRFLGGLLRRLLGLLGCPASS